MVKRTRNTEGTWTHNGRRDFLKGAGAVAGIVSIAGCSGTIGEDDSGPEYSPDDIPGPKTYAASDLYNIEDWRGDGPLVRDRPDEYTGLSVLDLPDLRGELTVYLGGGEGGTYVAAMTRIQNLYENFTVNIRTAPSSQHANTIVEETTAGRSPADIFWPIDAGSIGVVAQNDATHTLPDHVTQSIPDTYHPTDEWVGIMGRARSIPYNTNTFDEAEIPSSVSAFPNESAFEDAMGWAPSYGAFQSFITAMRLLTSREETRQWLEEMQDHGIETYGNEYQIALAVANGELRAGFSNHYYSRLVYEDSPDAPLDLAFTQNDAGALVNCAPAGIVRNTQNRKLAGDFIHHLLSIEVQEFLGTRAYGYPLLTSVPPLSDLPTIDQLNPPDFDLARLANVEPTLELLRDVGAL